MWIKPAYFPYFWTFNVTVMGSNPTFTFLIQTTNCNWNARKYVKYIWLKTSGLQNALFEFILSSLASNPKIVGLNPTFLVRILPKNI